MNAEAPSVRTPNSQSLWRVAVLAALVVGIEQTYYYAVRYTGVLGSWVAFSSSRSGSSCFSGGGSRPNVGPPASSAG